VRELESQRTASIWEHIKNIQEAMCRFFLRSVPSAGTEDESFFWIYFDTRAALVRQRDAG
jgi:hypothetical protein